MKFFANTRIKRNTALVALLVWLFALASSVANACFLETDKPHSVAAKESTPPASRVAAELPAQVGANAGHHDVSDSTKESCLKVCDDVTHSLPKAYSGLDHNDPGPAPLVTTLWTGSLHVLSAPRRVHDSAVPIAGPPLRVRFSRLVL